MTVEINHFTCFDKSPRSYCHSNYEKETEIQKNVKENIETLRVVNDNTSKNVIRAANTRVSNNDMVLTTDVTSVSKYSFLTTHTAAKDDVSANSASQRTLSSKVRPASGMKQPKPKLKANADLFESRKIISDEASNSSAKAKTRETKSLLEK
ncbi:hypothetical protein Tco_0378431 [Tanacetum coccineum]